jgi:hypothetical protein
MVWILSRRLSVIEENRFDKSQRVQRLAVQGNSHPFIAPAIDPGHAFNIRQTDLTFIK